MTSLAEPIHAIRDTVLFMGRDLDFYPIPPDLVVEVPKATKSFND